MPNELLLITLNGNRLAVRKDDVEIIRSIGNLTHLPFSQDGAAEIALINDRLVYLCDLAACVGFGAAEREKKNCALTLRGAEGVSGFSADGEIEEISVTQDELLPLPENFETDLVVSCLLDGCKPIPLVDLLTLHHRLQQEGLNKIEIESKLPAIDAEKAEPKDNVLAISIGGHRFALAAPVLETVQVRDQQIGKLPFAPPWIEGLIFNNSLVIPLIYLFDCLGLESSRGAELALVLDLKGQPVGFRLDSTCEKVLAESARIESMPALIASPVHQALLDCREVLPYINELTIQRALDKDSGTYSSSYKLEKEFPSLDRREGVDLVEITLNGQKYAVPECEATVVDSRPPVFRVPPANPVVVGLAEYEGEIDPVINLSAALGNGSHSESERKMIHISIGSGI